MNPSEENQQNDLRTVRNVYLLQGAQIDFYWADILETLRTLPRFYEMYSPEWVHEQVKSGHMLVWSLSDGSIRGIVLTRVLILPRQKVFEVMAIAGIGMLEFLDEIGDVFAKIAGRLGCGSVRAVCRPGMKRLLKKLHPEEEAVILSWQVPDIREQ